MRKFVVALISVPFLALGFVFPSDHFAHPDSGIEWWYQTGVLNGGRFSYEFTLFRNRLVGFDAYLLHVVIQDHEEGTRYFLEVPLRKGVETINGVFTHSGPSSGFVLGFHGRFWRVSFYSPDFDVYLTLFPKKPPVPHMGGEVDMVKGESYYYSVTDIDVVGWIRVRDEKVLVRGKTWFDHQWGDFEVVPWDWFSLRLDNGIEMMLFRFPGHGVEFSTVVWRDGSYEYVRDFEIDMRGVYGDIPIPPATVSIPALGASFELVPISEDQYNEAKYTPPYWEGVCRVIGHLEGEEVTGWAFFEGWR